MVRYDPKREENLRVKCINLSIKLFVQAIGEVLKKHRDKGRELEEEAEVVIRKVIVEIATEELQDSAVFLVDETPTPFKPFKRAWGEYDQPEELVAKFLDMTEEEKAEQAKLSETVEPDKPDKPDEKTE